MDLFNIRWEKGNLVVTSHWVFLLICLLIVILMNLEIVRKKFKNRKFLEVDQYTIDAGYFKTVIKYDFSDREIAYKAWVEMNTRKVGLMIDENNDVIVEVYNSWYAFFTIIRNTMKDLPGKKLDCSHDLIDLLTKVLNGKLRNHLTCWQAKFRKWYEEQIKDSENKCKTPQDIQREYERFDELIMDMKETNIELIALKNLLYKIAFDGNNKIDNKKVKM